MARNKVRVVIADDSAFMRKALKRMLHSDPNIKVIGEASNGVEATQVVRQLKPDVLTLDIRMPKMDGLQALEIIMQETPTAVLMVSSLTTESGDMTFRALELGAVDFIDKSSCHTTMDILEIGDSLLQKVKVLGGVDLKKIQRPQSKRPLPPPILASHPRPSGDGIPPHLVAIGVSTGGPVSIETVLRDIPADYSGVIVVVQHMPIGFTKSFAQRLDDHCALAVKEAEEDDVLQSGTCYIAPSGYHLTFRRMINRVEVALTKSPRNTMHCPSVDVMMESVAALWPNPMLSIIMTGMGNDGVDGIRAMKVRGATILAQNEATSVVFGMPKAAKESGMVDRVVGLTNLAHEIRSFPRK